MNLERLSTVGYLFIGLGVAILLWGLFRKLKDSTRKPPARQDESSGPSIVGPILLAALLVGLGQLLVWLVGEHENFYPPKPDRPVASLKLVIPKSGDPYLEVQELYKSGRYRLLLSKGPGELCRITANAIKWRKEFSFLGLKEYLRLTEVVVRDTADSAGARPAKLVLSEEAQEFASFLRSSNLPVVNSKEIASAPFPLLPDHEYQVFLQNDKFEIE